jgi:hypothetical protein
MEKYGGKIWAESESEMVDFMGGHPKNEPFKINIGWRYVPYIHFLRI